jgi:hypothetical protein
MAKTQPTIRHTKRDYTSPTSSSAKPRRREARKRVCRVCALAGDERDLIEGGIASGWTPRALEKRFGGITRRDISRHLERCVEKKPDQEEGGR